MSKIVSDIVIETQAAAAESIVRHFNQPVFQDAPDDLLTKTAAALDHGYDADLDEYISTEQPVGFNHGLISAVFRRRLSFPYLQERPGLSRHIWEADEPRHLYSLFGRPPATIEQALKRRTRVSAIVQRELRDCRSYRQAEKATTAEPSTKVTIPSPLSITATVLTDPKSPASASYAKSALQEWIRELLETRTDGRIDVSFAAISEALGLIKNRWNTSKPIVADLQRNGATVVFLCNLLAIHGYMAMRVDLRALRDLSTHLAADPTKESGQFEEHFERFLLGGSPGAEEETAEFIVNPHYVDLPSTGTILNLLEGIPLPLDGADIVFQQGIRLSATGSLVAAVSGTFGAGKTLFGLSVAAALAPLGCRTLFLSCEESPDDIEVRLLEVAPRNLFRSAPLFHCLQPADFTLPKVRMGEPFNFPWFMARKIGLESVGSGAQLERVDPAAALSAMLEDVLENAELFQPFRAGDKDPHLPRFARPVVIIDGLHQLFDLPISAKVVENSLRALVERCRELGAVFIFSFSSEATELKRLEYLCDLIIELDRGGFQKPAEKPRRYFQLMKARRQPSREGAHVFHLKGDAGFRIKPSMDARLQEAKRELWWEPDPRGEIFLTDEPPTGFRGASRDAPSGNIYPVRNRGQVLVIGRGSSGKAGYGLYLLHRRWFDRRLFGDDEALEQLTLLDGDHGEEERWKSLSARKQAFARSRLPIRFGAPFLETRVLVISFLYQKSYYDELTNRLSRQRRGKRGRGDHGHYGHVDKLSALEFAPLPDRLKTDTIELYPGMLSVEDFLTKVENALQQAENLGLPYTGVLIDGLHNVFVQFPGLEEESSFWGVFYNILRRRRVTVVTTHTEFDFKNQVSGLVEDSANHRGTMVYDFDQAQRKIAPLLAALVSGADYLFELSPNTELEKIRYIVRPLGSIGYDISPHAYLWEKSELRLSNLNLKTEGARHELSRATAAAERLINAVTEAMRRPSH